MNRLLHNMNTYDTDPCATQTFDSLDVFDARSLDDQMKDILESFDFLLMHRIMLKMDWKWAGINEVTGEYGYFPEEDDLRILAQRLLFEVAGEDAPFASRQTCGFIAQKRHGYLALYFVATYWEVLP